MVIDSQNARPGGGGLLSHVDTHEPLRSVAWLVVEGMFEAIDRGDWQRLRDIFEADCTYDRPGYPKIEGIEPLLNFYRFTRRIEVGRHRIDRFVDDGTTGFAYGMFNGRLKDGCEVSAEFAEYYSLKGSRISARKTFFSVAFI